MVALKSSVRRIMRKCWVGRRCLQFGLAIGVFVCMIMYGAVRQAVASDMCDTGERLRRAEEFILIAHGFHPTAKGTYGESRKISLAQEIVACLGK